MGNKLFIKNIIFVLFLITITNCNMAFCAEEPVLKWNYNQPPLKWGYNDLNNDGTPETLLYTWNGKTVIFVNDDGQLPWSAEQENQDWNAYFNKAFNVEQNPPVMWNPIRNNWGNYTILVDKDSSGRFDDNNDFYYKAMDLNNDGQPEAEFLVPFPGRSVWGKPYSAKLHINLNGENDMCYLSWKDFFYPDEQTYTDGFKYIMNIHGSGLFMNCYRADIIKSWENPIAWYDFDFDGRTNMVMRCADTFPGENGHRGAIGEAEFAFELNSKTSEKLWSALDLQLTYYDSTQGFDISKYADRIEKIKGLKEADFLSEKLLAHRQEALRLTVPYLDGYMIMTDYNDWEGAWFIFDEDDEDVRWEEMFSVHEKINGEFSDRIGDRWEHDKDFSGKGKLYVGKFDGRIHLFGADEGYWEIDYLGLYHGSCDRGKTKEGPKPPKGLKYPLVRYYDSDKNGFIDKIEYSTVEYQNERQSKNVVKIINLFDYVTAENPHPDVCELFNPKVDVPLKGFKIENWDAQSLQAKDFENSPIKAAYDKFYKFYGTVGENLWNDAEKLYAVAKKT